MSLLNSAPGQISGKTDLHFLVSDWPKLQKSRIPFWAGTLSAFRWYIKRLQPASDLRVTAVRNSTDRWNNFSCRSYLPVWNRFLVKFRHDLPRNFAYKKCCQRTQLSAGYSYDSFQHTVGSLRHFEALLHFWTHSGQTGLHSFGQVFGPQNGWYLLGSEYNFWKKLSHLSDAYSNSCFW
jgi:hypothetical protein